MGSETIKLPVIDFSNLKQESQKWESVKIQVREAMEEYGCFEATIDQIPLHFRKLILEEVQQLFDLPMESKLRNSSDRVYHGYVGQIPSAPLFESMGIDDALSPGNIEAFANLMWSQEKPAFSKSVQSLAEQLSELDKNLRRMVVESLGLEKYMDDHIDSTEYLVRFQKYREPESDDTKVGLTPHKDQNMTTILYQMNEVNGFEVLTKDEQWIPTQPSVNSFLVMAGESLHAWTNGRVHPSFHRVMMTGNETRYTFATFSIPKTGYIIKAPEELVDEEHPLLFKPYDYAQFLKFYKTEAIRTYPNILKAYCGV